MRLMRYMFELREQIEKTRKELDVAAQKGLEGAECYQISLRLDRMIADYMRLKEEKIQLWHCS